MSKNKNKNKADQNDQMVDQNANATAETTATGETTETTATAETAAEEALEEVKVEAPTVKEGKDNKPSKPKFRGIGLKDYGCWTLRPCREGDLDANGKQIPEDRDVFVLMQKDIPVENLKAYPLVYDNVDGLNVAYKRPQIRNSQKGVMIEGVVHNTYKQHTVMVEWKNGDKMVGLAGYWNTALTQADLDAIEAKKTAIEEAAAKKTTEKEEKKKQKEAAAAAKAAAAATAAESGTVATEEAPVVSNKEKVE